MSTEIVVRVMGEVIRVPKASAVVGRGTECEVRADDHGVSRRHCEIVLRPDGVVIRDLGSTHGTWMAGKRRIVSEMQVEGRAFVTLGQQGLPVEILRAELDGRVLVREGSSSSALEPSHTVEMSASQIEATRRASLAAAASPDSAAPAAAPRGFAAGLLVGLAVGAAIGFGLLFVV